MLPYIPYIVIAVASFFTGGYTVWYVLVRRDRKKRTKQVYESIQESLEGVDRDFDMTITMTFGVPGFAQTKVQLRQKEE